jgi:SAM-dependent methyltransferase
VTDHANRWSSGEAYVRYVGRWSLLVGREFLKWLDCPPTSRWLDVGCGPGTLTQLILETENPSAITGIDPSPGFITYAGEHIRDPRAEFLVGDARSLPFEVDSFDSVVTGLVLNFVPPAEQFLAASELRRVCRPGGMVAAYVWDYADGQQMMRYFWEAAIDLNPSARDQAEALQFPLCHPDPLRMLLEEAGLDDVQTRAIEIETVFANFDDYWTPLLSGEAPVPAYNKSLAESERNRLRDELRNRLPVAADGSITLTARAWAVRGTVPD